MLFADTGLSLEPVTPWSLPAVGPAAMLGVALVLAGLTLWTYLGVQQATWRRVLVVLLLRLAALALVFGMMLRPSFATTQLEGVEITKLFVIFDKSASMNVADVDGQPSRWEHVNRLWASREVQSRLRQLAAEQKIEVVKYLGAADLQADQPEASADGKRTDVGAWLHQLWLKHGHEKHVRGIVLLSDGADNGTRFAAQEKARQWRGFAPIHAFGVGDPQNAKFKKDIGLTDLKVRPSPVAVREELVIDAVAQAPGFGKVKVDINVWLENVSDRKPLHFKEIKDFEIKQEKDQHIVVKGPAPEEAGEYKVTLKITPHPDEANKENNEISTYVQVIKKKINVLWVDRFRVWEPTLAIRYALAPEQRLAVHFVTVPAKGDADPHKFYKFDKPDYDVIVIGDISAQDFALGDDKFFQTIKKMVEEKNTGLLMLGGTQTFCKGGWSRYPDFMSLLPVKFDATQDKAEFSTVEVQPTPTVEGKDYPFLRLEADPTKNVQMWKNFEPLEGIAPVGEIVKDATPLLKGGKGEVVMAATRAGRAGRVVVFAGDSTHTAWRDNPDAIRGYNHFWKNLVFWLAKQEDKANQLWITLDKRRMNTDAADVLGFTFGLKGRDGKELPKASFTAKVVRDKQELPVQHVAEGRHQRGSFLGAKEPGEYQLVITGTAEDGGQKVEVTEIARFLVASEDVEMLRPAAEHETLTKIAASADGRFHLAQEQQLLQYLDELKSQVNRESRLKTVHWPDWRKVPASESARDQLPALWNSFALMSLLLFVALVGSEWGLRRWWGLV
ncbi:MAG: hypothetical protein EXR98_09390 [Gemmataceae bacterium]|nr:hypothetical protein [Gemmataceae bacterium]